MTDNSIIAQHDIPRPIEVVPADLVQAMERLTAEAADLAIDGQEAFDRGNALLMEIHGTDKAIEKRRKELKRPVTDLGRLIDQIAKRALEPIGAAKRSLQQRVHGWQREQERIAEEARRKAEEERRKAEEAERKAREEAERKAAEEAAELEALLGAPVEPKPVPEPEPVKAPPPAPIPEAPKATALQTRKIKQLEIYAPDQVPVQVGMVEVRPIDQKAVRKLLDAGVEVPGARIIEVEQVAMARGASS